MNRRIGHETHRNDDYDDPRPLFGWTQQSIFFTFYAIPMLVSAYYQLSGSKGVMKSLIA